MQKVRDIVKLALNQWREMLFYPAILYIIAFIFGLIFFWGDGGLVHIDEMHWIERAHFLVATGWIPRYNWQHTQLYNYFLAFCILVFGENYFLIHLVQNFLIACFPVIVYFTLRYCFQEDQKTQPDTGERYQVKGRKGSFTIPIFGSCLALTCFCSTYITANLLLENLGFLFFGLSLHLWHRYYIEAGTKSDMKNLFWASVCTGITFNFKETSTLLYLIPLIYVFWRVRKTLTFQKVIISFGILLIAVAPFLLIQLVSDFYYFQFFLEASASARGDFLGSLLQGVWELFEVGINYMPIQMTMGMLGLVWFIISRIRKRSRGKVLSRFDNLAFISVLSILAYGIFLVFRPGIQYSILLLVPLTILSSWFISQILPQNKIPQEMTEGNIIPKKGRNFLKERMLLIAIIGGQVIYTGIAMGMTKPVIYQSYNVWTQISSRVGNNATYLCNAFGDILFSNAYGPSTWHASYRRNGWQSYNQDDLRELTDDTLFHEWNIKNIVVGEGAAVNTYISNLISTNGTLVLRASYLFIETTGSPFIPTNYTILLYYIHG